MSDATSFYTVRTKDGKTHDMILCQCCVDQTAEYYALIGWQLWLVRPATQIESLDHCCLS